jgi:thiol-disulfide isomerase/thioredoxin
MTRKDRCGCQPFAAIVWIAWGLGAMGCGTDSAPDSGGVETTVATTNSANDAPAANPATDSAWVPPASATLPPSGASTGGPAAEPTSGTQFGNGDVTVKFVDTDAYRAAIEQHKGKVVLVDFWATWCGPCMEDFPHTVEFARKFQDQGLDVVSVNFDDADKQAGVLDFLQKQRATFENLMSLHGLSAESFVGFDIIGGALPYYKLYDRQGKLRYQFTGNAEDLKDVLSSKELDQRVSELLAERSP